MITLDTLLIVFAFVCFVLAAGWAPSGRISLVPAGLAFWVATMLF